MRTQGMPPVQHPPVMLRGGLDQITPSLSLAPGFCLDAINYEASVTGGYTRIKGYERFDGRPKPSDGVFTVVKVSVFTNVPVVGQTLTGGTSGATGVISMVTTDSMVLTKLSVATFTDTEAVLVGATPIGTAIPITAAPTAQERAQYLNSAADIYRADIGAVGGASCSGSVLGVFMYADVVYAFRANSGGTAVTLWKSSTGGWVNVPMVNEVTFDTAVGTGTGNLVAPADGTVITGGTSTKTATVRRVMLETGSWRTAATTVDAGRFIYTNLNGVANFTVGETVTFSGGATAIVRTVGTAITLAVGGKFETVLGNFGGQAASKRIYGADGVNRGFEFDGTYLCPISTGTTPDTPLHVAYHLNYLFFTIQGALIYSEVAYPFRFATGGNVYAGDTITGIMELPGSQDVGSLAVSTPNSMKVLYGNAPPFRLPNFNVGAGSIDYTMQNFDDMLFFNENGVNDLGTTLRYGNFAMSSLTDHIQPFVDLERSKVAYSSLCRDKNQYRVFFNDGLGLYLTVVKGSKRAYASMPVYFPNVVYCAWEGRLTTNDEVSFFGSTDGYVMQMEKGTSFDGEDINALIQLNWFNNGSPREEKTFHHATVEIRSPTYAAISFSYELGYGSADLLPATSTAVASDFQGISFWDLFTWDDFQWDGRSLLPSEIDMEGTAENCQVVIASGTDYIAEFTINSLIFSLINRRAKR